MRLLLYHQKQVRQIALNECFADELKVEFHEGFYLGKKRLESHQWLYFRYHHEQYGLWIEDHPSYSYIFPCDLWLEKDLPKEVPILKLKANGEIEPLGRQWAKGDGLDYYQYHLEWHEFGWLVNTNLLEKKVKIEKHHRKELYFPKIEEPIVPKISDPSISSNHSKRSLFLQMGPGLTMAFATLMNAMVQSIRLYEQGKPYEELLFVFLMPMMMLISILLWQPLNRFAENKQEKKIQEAQKEEYRKKAEKNWHSFLTIFQSYQETIKQSFFSLDSCLRHPSGIWMGLGFHQETIPYLIPKTIKKLKIENFTNQQLLFSSSEKDFIQWIRRWDALYRASDVPAYLLASKTWFSNYPEVLQLPIFYHHGKRHLYEDGQTFEMEEGGILFSLIPLTDKHKGTCFVWSHQALQYPFEKRLLYCQSKMIVEDQMEKRIYHSLDIERKDYRADPYQIQKIKSNPQQKGLVCVMEEGNLSLDLSENKMGPHAIITGTTGSGKSELVLYWLLSMAKQNSPEQLQILLFDFKGDSLKQSLRFKGKTIPHINASISDLQVDEVDRALCGLEQECRYREALFQKASTCFQEPITSLAQYQKYQKKGWERLPEIVLVFDEFAQFKQRFPDKLNPFVSLARIGRSLGIHFILITQKASGVISEQIWANIRLRICMKVTDRQDCLDTLHQDRRKELKSAGDFIAHYDEAYIQGHCPYLEDYISPKENKVELDHQLQPMPTYKKGQIRLREYLLEKIIEKKEENHLRSIWLKAPSSDLLRNSLLGILDDYETARYISIPLEEVKRPILFIYDDPKDLYYLKKRLGKDTFQARSIHEKIGLSEEEKYFILYKGPLTLDRMSQYFHQMKRIHSLRKGEALCLYQGKIQKILIF